MTNKEVIDFLKSEKEATRKLASTCNSDKIDYFTKHEEAYDIAIKSLEAWEKIDDDIASLQDIYFIGGSETEKAIWENLQAVRKTIHEYLKEVSE